MSKKARLMNMAGGLCGAFGSRNNDLDGYWSIGKLRSLAAKYDEPAVSIDLLDASMQPWSSEFACLLTRYRRLFTKLADVSGVPLGQITTARMVVDFAPPPWPKPGSHRSDWGDPFILTVTIRTDGRGPGIMHQIGYCRPHDPTKESRSTRPGTCR